MIELVTGFYILGGLLLAGFVYFIVADHFDEIKKEEEAPKALAEYELNKSTGAVQRVSND